MIRRLIWLYPPFLFSGISIRILSTKPLVYRSSLKCRWWNRNSVGTHFGGSLFAMSDPFYMLILMDSLGSGYVVWDKSSRIEYLKPGKGRVSAEFSISQERLEEICREATSGPVHPEFVVEIKEDDGTCLARITKTLYVRKRRGSKS